MKFLPLLLFGLVLAAPAASAHSRHHYHYHDWGEIEERTKRSRTKYDWKHCQKIKTTRWQSPHGRQTKREVTRIRNCSPWHHHYDDHHYYDHHDLFYFGVRVRVD